MDTQPGTGNKARSGVCGFFRVGEGVLNKNSIRKFPFHFTKMGRDGRGERKGRREAGDRESGKWFVRSRGI